MKINKNTVLLEADDQTINPEKDSVAEISDVVQDVANVDEKSANEIATEIKEVGDEVDAGDAVVIPAAADDDDEYVTTNRLTNKLDKALRAATKYMRTGAKTGANVLVCGLPGSAKTAIVENWCKQHGLVMVAMNAADSKIDSAVNGMPLRDASDAEANKVVYAYSMEKLGKLLDPKNAGKCVLFVDEYNRQTDMKLRRTFMSLFNEKRNADGSLDFRKNLLFTVVCINPSLPTDKGAAPLNDAERSRFAYNLYDFDSDINTAHNWFVIDAINKLTKLGVPNAKELGAIYNEPIKTKSGKEITAKNVEHDEFYDADVNSILAIVNLADHILKHPSFRFDNKDDLRPIYDDQLNLLNQRALTDGINNADANADNWSELPNEFIEWVREDSRFLKNDISMFEEILEDYNFTEAELNGIKSKLGIEVNTQNGTNSNTVETSQDDYDEEDDADLFQGGKTVTNSTKAADDIDDLLNNLFADVQ